MKSVVTDEFSILNKDSLILILGGQAHTVAAGASCGSSRSSSECDGTAVCNCQCPIGPIKKPTKESFI
ncbi:MAG: hypothetical protein IKS65_02650 [Bacteroidales bacterium]|nr:hypothetical protein [Bacteroidales bacterium]